MKIIQTNGHNEICNGYSYNYQILLEHPHELTINFLKELKEYTNQNPNFCALGEFGCKEGKGAWSIYINDNIYLSAWNNQIPSYNKKDLMEPIKFVIGKGGWYSGINIYIYTL